MDIGQRSLLHSTYFAPRGRDRLSRLATHLAQRYLTVEDKLIGFVGGPGAGKSVIISGMFPGLLLTNDDEGVNIRPLPLMEAARSGYFKHQTYH